MRSPKNIHASMARLYEAAKLLNDEARQSKLANLLGVLSQNVNNWEKRGLSKREAIKAQRLFGCDAGYLLNGDQETNKPPIQFIAGGTDDARRVNIRMVIDAMLGGDIAALAEKTEFPVDFLNDLLAGARPIGRGIPRFIEQALNLEPGILDDSPSFSDPSRLQRSDPVLAYLAELEPDEADLWRSRLKVAAMEAKINRQRQNQGQPNATPSREPLEATAPKTKKA